MEAQEKKEEKLSYRDRLRGKYPDMAAETDEDYAVMSEKYLDDSEAELSRFHDSEAAVSEIIKSDPVFEAVVTDMLVDNIPFIVALQRHVPVEELTLQEGDDNYEQWAEAKSQRLAKAAKAAEQQKEIAENEVASSNLFNEFASEKGMDEAEKDEFLTIINDALFALLYKKIDRKFLELCFKGSRFDKAVEQAEKIGEMNGRNANIEAKKVSEKAKMEGDGIPGSAGASASVSPQRKKRPNAFFSGIREHKDF